MGVILLAAVLLSGCGGATAPASARSTTTPERSVVIEQLHPLAKALRTAFVSGGAQGFFVEGQPSTSDAMDLYQTAWWALAAPNAWRARLDRRTVGAWAMGSLYLRPGASGAQYGSLAQISLALQLVTLLPGCPETAPACIAVHCPAWLCSLASGCKLSRSKDMTPSVGDDSIALRGFRG